MNTLMMSSEPCLTKTSPFSFYALFYFLFFYFLFFIIFIFFIFLLFFFLKGETFVRQTLLVTSSAKKDTPTNEFYFIIAYKIKTA